MEIHLGIQNYTVNTANTIIFIKHKNIIRLFESKITTLRISSLFGIHTSLFENTLPELAR